MRIKKGFNIRNVCGQLLVMAEGKENLDFTEIVSMNESSALLWEKIQGKAFTAKDLARILMDEYQIDDNTPLPEEKAMQDAEAVIRQWKEIGMIEE